MNSDTSYGKKENPADEIVRLAKEIRDVQKDRDILKQQIEDLIQQQSLSEQRMQERFREIAGLSRLLQERDLSLNDAQAQMQWLRQIVNVLTMNYSRSIKARLMIIIPLFFSIIQQKSLLKRKKLFDPKEYIALYPDVSESGVDPLRHYINHGMQEGRKIRLRP